MHDGVLVAHQPKWSLVLGSFGSVFAFMGRAIALHDDSVQTHALANQTIDISKIRYLDPFKDTGHKDTAV